MVNIQSIRGMKDILPEEITLWQWCEKRIKEVTERYCYHEIRLPILEPVTLFERAVGESTDIVAKEMYDFHDKSGEHITLRPEGTSGCVRAIIEHNLCYNTHQRLWYLGAMFRYERPQKGRLRQFTQFGVEAFGMQGPDIDLELILLVKDLFKEIGIIDHVELQINSLGTSSERKMHRQALVDYLIKHKSHLDEDSLKRLDSNPLRILDSKNPDMQDMINQAPQLLNYLDNESLNHFDKLCHSLQSLNIKYEINPRLVRGLDYYTRTVFEWVTEALGAQGTVCGGGRYDGLVELFDNKKLPAAGFAIGMERLILLVQTINQNFKLTNRPDIIITSEQNDSLHILLAEEIRKAFPYLKVMTDCSERKIKRQHADAIKSCCLYVITLQAENKIKLWDLTNRERKNFTTKELLDFLQINTTAY